MSPKMTDTFLSRGSCSLLVVVIVVIVSISSSAAMPAQVENTTCDVNNITQTSLTCYFQEDISKTKAKFIVYHNTSHGEKGPVVKCDWIKSNLNCITARGYEFGSNATDQLTLRIPRLQDNDTGTCSCHITDHLPAPVTSSCHYPRVLEKEPSSLTCTYSVDVNATTTDFMVVRDGGAGEKGTRIASCVWVSDDLNCTTAPGYELSSAVTDVVVITTPQASRDQAGSYACHVIGSEAEGFESCEFIVVTGDSKIHTDSSTSFIIIIGGGAGGGFVLIIIIIIVVVKCRKSRDVNIQSIASIAAEKQAARKSDSSAGTGAGAAGNDSKSGGSSARSSSSGSDKPSSNPNYTSTALQEVEIHAYMDLHTRDPTYAATASKKDNHTYIELRTKRMQSEPPQPPAEGSRNSAIYANQGRSPKTPVVEEEEEDETNYYNTA